MKELKKYWLFIAVVIVDVILVVTTRDLGQQVVRFTAANFKEMLLIIPPVFILLGLMDVWVPRELMVRLMGKGSGVRGTALAIFLGAASAGPLYGAFPVAVVLTKKGASLKNVFVFVGAWATLKIPMFLFETAALGLAWSITRWLASFVGILTIATVMERSLKDEDKEDIVHRANEIEVPQGAKRVVTQ